MKFTKRILIGVILMLSFAALKAQEKSPVKFGKISPSDFDVSKYTFDSSANALVIADIGSSEFEGNSKGWFSLVFKHLIRIKILNKNGFDAAKVDIPLYSTGTDEEKIANLKAFTYNLENGVVIKTELESNAIFTDKLSKNVGVRKFTFPAIKEGSLIEYSYTVKSDFLFNLQPWSFQGEYPRLWSEYSVGMPDFFKYVTIGQGYNPFFINTSEENSQNFKVTIPGGVSSNEHVSFNSSVNNYRWVMKDVPPLKKEAFTSSISNHISKLEFQLSQFRFPNEPVKDIMGNWFTVSQELLKSENFGAALNKNNNWLDDELKSLLAGATTKPEKARRIFYYLRDNFTCTDHSDLYINNPLKTVFKNRNGSVSDINMLLIAMLRHENIDAEPAILSTRENGFANEIYPILSQFNYVIAQAKINEQTFQLDASHPLLGFGKLPIECYNGSGRVIGNSPLILDLQADSVLEKKVTTVFISNNDKGELTGFYNTTPGYYESYEIRKKIKEKGEADYFKKTAADYGSDFELLQPQIDSLKNNEEPLSIHYDFKLKSAGENTIYFSPMMMEAYKSNIFKSSDRNYPVEMPYRIDDLFILNMDIPVNYTVEELPKSTKVTVDDGNGYFEYLFAQSGNTIQMRSRLIMKKTVYQPEDYNDLREFFGFIVKKQSEQIVFKKKK